MIEIRNSHEPEEPRKPFESVPQKPPFGYLVGQALSPPETLLGFWDVAHSLRNQAEYQLLVEANHSSGVELYHFVFAYSQRQEDEVEPLSWHLTAQDKARIKQVWQCHRPAAEALARRIKSLAKPGPE